MLFKKTGLCLAVVLSTSLFQVQASEFDQYLQSKQIIDKNYKIIKPDTLNELLAVLSAEDSKTLPLEVDNNTVIEQLGLYANRTELKGLIITPDFTQFEQDLGHKEVKKLIMKNLIQSCNIFYEHHYQQKNPYTVFLKLTSAKNSYNLELKQADCGFQ